MASKNYCYQPLYGWRCVSTPIQTGGMTTFGPSTTNISNKEASQRYVLKIMLLRTEVIQPHLPVRLPCYDFVPIADPTFDSSLTSLGHWLRVLPTFMTDRKSVRVGKECRSRWAADRSREKKEKGVERRGIDVESGGRNIDWRV